MSHAGSGEEELDAPREHLAPPIVPARVLALSEHAGRLELKVDAWEEGGNSKGKGRRRDIERVSRDRGRSGRTALSRAAQQMVPHWRQGAPAGGGAGGTGVEAAALRAVHRAQHALKELVVALHNVVVELTDRTPL